MVNKSCFLTIEGIEGVGKSSAVQMISHFLKDANVPYVTTREPGGTLIAEAIRQILLQHFSEKMESDTELLLLFASRAQHISQIIKPALVEGKWVICDRFTDASYAYQGGGRHMSMQRIEVLENWVQAGLEPDITLLLDAPVEIALKRIQKRQRDRIEEEEYDFFARVRETYLERAEQYPNRYRLVDARGSKEDVKQQIEAELKGILGG